MEDKSSSENQNNMSVISKCNLRTMGELLVLLTAATLYILARAIILNDNDFNIGNAHILAYFTIQSNMLSALWMLFMSLYILTERKIYRFAININFSASITVYTLIAGIIFWIVLVPIFLLSSEIELFTPQIMWIHTVTPIITLIMLRYSKYQNSEGKVKSKPIFFAIYPALYLIFACIMAANDTYLYPTLNPSFVGGWLGVGVCALFSLFFVVVIYLLIMVYLNKREMDE